MPELTSLKVPVCVRDRLVTAAQARGLTVRALLDELSRKAADDAMMAQAGAEMDRLRDSDPDGWRGYLGEGLSWEKGTVERLDA
jgi:hypothetical protein